MNHLICQQMITRSQRQKSSNWPLAFRSSWVIWEDTII